MELNPNNPITQQMHDHWHKVVALLMVDFGITEFEITEEMLKGFEHLGGGAVVADARGGRFVVRLVDWAEAERLARKEGGLPA